MRSAWLSLVALAALAAGCSKKNESAQPDDPAATPAEAETAPGAATADDEPPSTAPPLTPTPIVNPDEPAPPDSAANGAVGLLRKGTFPEALARADAVLANKPDDPDALMVRAFARYIGMLGELRAAFENNVDSADNIGQFAHASMQKAYAKAAKTIEAIQADLEVLARNEDLAFDLCVACWEYDWNGTGSIDDGDRMLLQLEVDYAGKPIPEGDPRRRPVFRLDRGDVYWAQAMLDFQHGLLDLVQAFDWKELDKLIGSFDQGPTDITIQLTSKDKIDGARARFATALERADAARRAYLAETDDEREWVPSPAQRNYAMPLQVSEGLYQTWEGVNRDLRALLDGTEGIDLAELSQLAPDLEVRPTGYLDVGGMLHEPRDMVFRLRTLMKLDPEDDPDAFLTELFGEFHKKHMKASALTGRLLRMKRELDDGSDTLDRKLRYLIWLN